MAEASTEANGGPLLLACFHVLWMKDCVRAMSSAKELATAYPACKFCSVPADTLELQHVSRRYKVETFPTFILFRGGEEIQRVTGTERVAENIVRMLTTHINADDIAAYELRKKQKEEEELARKMEEDPTFVPNPNATEEEGNGQIEWVWNVDGTGAAMRIEELGMQLVLRGEDEDEEEVVWEYCLEDSSGWGEDGDSGWTPFPEEYQVEIEGMIIDVPFFLK